MRHLRTGLLALAVVLASSSGEPCSTDPDGGSLRRALEAMPLTLGAAHGSHVGHSLRKLREACSRLRAGREDLHELKAELAEARVISADVGLVADIHTLDLCRDAFSSACSLVHGNLRVDGGEHWRAMAFGVEAFPVNWQSLVEGVRWRHDDLRGVTLHTLLRYYWPWPVDRLAAVIDDSRLRGIPLRALGGARWPAAVPPSIIPDQRRAPSRRARISGIRERALFDSASEDAAEAIHSWLSSQGGPERPVLVALYGLAHCVAPERGIPARLASHGLECVVVIPFLREFAEILVSRGSESALGSSWFELAPGTL